MEGIGLLIAVRKLCRDRVSSLQSRSMMTPLCVSTNTRQGVILSIRAGVSPVIFSGGASLLTEEKVVPSRIICVTRINLSRRPRSPFGLLSPQTTPQALYRSAHLRHSSTRRRIFTQLNLVLTLISTSSCRWISIRCRWHLLPSAR